MADRVCRLASNAGAQQLAASTRQVLGVWLARWGLQAWPTTVDAAPWDATGRPPVGQAGRWWDASVPARGSLLWPTALEAAVLDALYPRCSDEPVPREDSMARANARQACLDLRRMLTDTWFQADLVDGSPDWSISRWDAPVRVEVALDKGLSLTAVVPCPPTGAGRSQDRRLQALQQDVSAFARVPAAPELVVGHADIALPDALALQVGDVIVLDALLKDPLELRWSGGEPLLQAYLGRAGTRRAVQLVSSSPQRGVLS